MIQVTEDDEDDVVDQNGISPFLLQEQGKIEEYLKTKDGGDDGYLGREAPAEATNNNLVVVAVGSPGAKKGQHQHGGGCGNDPVKKKPAKGKTSASLSFFD